MLIRNVGILFLALALPAMAQKKRVAVVDFEYGTVQSGAAAIFGQNLDVGRGIADLLVEQLVRDGTYSVIERKAIQKIMAEQNFSNSDRADPNSAAKIGKLLGVDAIIMGSITQFGRDDRNVGAGGGLIRGKAAQMGLGNIGLKSSKAVVAISARVVSVDTGEILSISNGKGESKRSGTSLGGAGGSGGTAAGGAISMTSSNFANTIIGEATTEAVANLRGELVAGASKLPEKVVNIDGLIADVSGSTLVLNVGTRVGVRVGQVLQVQQAGREIRDPATGRVIRRLTTPIGEVRITEADELSSVGTYSGAGKPKNGDSVKSMPK